MKDGRILAVGTEAEVMKHKGDGTETVDLGGKGLESISISLRDIVAAFIGSLVFLLLLWIVRTSRSGPS